MKKAENLKQFLGHIINHTAKGYIYYKIVEIPAKKLHKKEKILKKIENNYQTFMSRSQRAYAKKKGFVNFQAVNYKSLIVILHTEGEIKPEIDLGKGFIPFTQKNRLELNISPYLQIVIFRDERGKITARIGKETLQDYKNELREAFKTKNGYRFHKTIKRFQGLPLYRGILKQKKDTLKWVHTQQKNFGTKWNIPNYL